MRIFEKCQEFIFTVYTAVSCCRVFAETGFRLRNTLVERSVLESQVKAYDTMGMKMKRRDIKRVLLLLER